MHEFQKSKILNPKSKIKQLDSRQRDWNFSQVVQLNILWVGI